MYTNAQYINSPATEIPDTIRVDINGITSFVPVNTDNGDYVAMMSLVDAGELVIAPAS
jgi:hypothetical protein